MKTEQPNTQEFLFRGVRLSGFTMILIQIMILSAILYLISMGQVSFIVGVVLMVLNVFLMAGYMQIEPNEARVLIFYGKYSGSIKENGFFWVNPFFEKAKLTQRARNLDVEPIKVNDKAGNPVMIGLVLVWKIKDTYKAKFDVDCSHASTSKSSTSNSAKQMLMDSLQDFVAIQSDSALRNIAGEYAYDNNENHEEVTLRSGSEEVADKLEGELNSRLSIAGIEVVEARINYLAYAPEIAAVMLRRQQAAAIISAREKIVEGAVSMVSMALDKLHNEKIVELDEEKKAAMVSNLLVVLCSDEQAQPIVNTGTLHH